jgi:LmbE family N-acetylglucosaminyl deacetylase
MNMNILALGAHPDDIEFGCAGTLAKYARRGQGIYLMILTKGEKGGDGEERAKEQKEAQQSMLAKKIFWGDFKDTALPPQGELIKAVEEVILEVKPNMIFVNYIEDTHQDHRDLARAVNSSARHIRNVLYYEVPTTQNYSPTIFVDIEKYMDIKVQALMAHRSQIMKTNVESISILEIARSLSNFRGIQAKMKYAEAFMPQRLAINI